MKILHKSFQKDGAGSLRIVPEDEEDLWHVYNLVRAGDLVKAVTTRKVQVGNAADKTERVRVKIAVEVDSVDYDGAAECRCKGRCRTENDHIALGAFHTLVLEPRTELTLSKACWDRLDLERLQQAANPAAAADLAVVLLDDGLAHVCLVGRSSTLLRAKVQVALPKKRGAGSVAGFNEAWARFMMRTYEAVLAHVDFAVVRCLLLAGPGFAKDKFREFLLATAAARGDRVVTSHKDVVITAAASSAYLQAIEELLGGSGVAARVADTKAAQEVKALEDFFAMLMNDSSRAFYGPGHVVAAAEQGAVGTLLISDALYRVHNVAERRRWVQLVEDVEAAGGRVFVFSSRHVSGKQLLDFSGVAAVLRFPMPDLEERDPAELLAALQLS